MLRSTQDDSLVFATESHWPDKKWSEPDLANTSDIFGSPKQDFETTQADPSSELHTGFPSGSGDGEQDILFHTFSPGVATSPDASAIGKGASTSGLSPSFSRKIDASDADKNPTNPLHIHFASSPLVTNKFDLRQSTLLTVPHTDQLQENATQIIPNERATQVIHNDGATQVIHDDGATQVIHDDGATQVLPSEQATQLIGTTIPSVHQPNLSTIATQVIGDSQQSENHCAETQVIPCDIDSTSNSLQYPGAETQKIDNDCLSQTQILHLNGRSTTVPSFSVDAKSHPNGETSSSQKGISDDQSMLSDSTHKELTANSADEHPSYSTKTPLPNSSPSQPSRFEHSTSVNHFTSNNHVLLDNTCSGETQIINDVYTDNVNIGRVTQVIDPGVKQLSRKSSSTHTPSQSHYVEAELNPKSNMKSLKERNTELDSAFEFPKDMDKGPLEVSAANNHSEGQNGAATLLAKFPFGSAEKEIFSSPNEAIPSHDNKIEHIQKTRGSINHGPETDDNDYDISINDTTFDCQHQGLAGEATTQVLNTQEEIYDDASLKLVDLGTKPVSSSSQNDLKRELSSLSISDVEEGVHSDFEDSTFVCEDSIFNLKKRKLTSRILRTGITHNSQSDVLEKLSQVDSLDATQTEGRDQCNLLSLVTTGALSTSSLPHRLNDSNWSTSSSDLEDISQDPSETLLLDQPTDSFHLTAEEPSQEIKFAKPRRDNGVPDEQNETQETILRQEKNDSLDVASVCNAQAVWVFSLFRNFPAIVLTVGEESSLVLMHNLKEITIRNSDLNILDLRIGDSVLVSLKFGQYLVTGLTFELGGSRFNCLRGHNTVFLLKKGRHSNVEFKVPLHEVCMEADQLAAHHVKFRLMSDTTNLLQLTYLEANHIIKAKASLNSSQGKLMNQNANSVQLSLLTPQENTGIFSGMFFFVTSIEGERKDQLNKLVTSNGGLFIDDEIDLILEKTHTSLHNCALSLQTLEHFKFGALLSDGFSRSAKYLQALALGWPILADAFVEKALDNPSLLFNWPAFLLPAGVSLYFKGTKSHDVFQFRNKYEAGMDMSLQLNNNSSLMTSRNILILERNQDQKVLSMCGFIFHAFGSRSITSFKDISSIENYIRKNGGDSFTVYDNSDHEFRNKFARKDKRKPSRSNLKVDVVDWEWVVQCVISNLVWEPGTLIFF
ncbi:hypothetical protein PUMCH_000409 [Australozyma saopauloensis]|uniref:BRCT domain-containing protein n=1 Tax=Australozyma saopauloensis TaxID=291208 RepID=A0AAX4H4R4_9ASCO|nr:hypothetical protein PUMCH_000409 [[Candida] saopauloensis]